MKHRSCGWNENYLLEVPTGPEVEWALVPGGGPAHQANARPAPPRRALPRRMPNSTRLRAFRSVSRSSGVRARLAGPPKPEASGAVFAIQTGSQSLIGPSRSESPGRILAR